MAKPRLPVDAHSVEIAPGIYVPANRLDEFAPFAQVIADMHTCTIEVAPHIEVQRKDVAAWEYRMNHEPEFCMAMDCLMDRLNSDALTDVTITLNLTPAARQIIQRDLQCLAVAPFALHFGTH